MKVYSSNPCYICGKTIPFVCICAESNEIPKATGICDRDINGKLYHFCSIRCHLDWEVLRKNTGVIQREN